MNRLRQAALPALAAVCLAGLPACNSSEVKHDTKKTGSKVEKAGKKAAKKAKKKVNGY